MTLAPAHAAAFAAVGAAPGGADAAELLREVVSYDVAYVPGAPFYAADPDPRTLRLCFVTQDETTIREGLERLGAALRG